MAFLLVNILGSFIIGLAWPVRKYQLIGTSPVLVLIVGFA